MTAQHTACILCSRNCGLEVETNAHSFTRIRGDKNHPMSAGYICQKAARLQYYQTNDDRLTHPMKRLASGAWVGVSWDEAIAEIAQKLRDIRDRHGAKAFAYYGGGGQGNHLGGLYGSALTKAMRSPFHYSPLAQEKTGDFWVNGKLFGRQTCHTTEDVEHSDYVLFVGTNPWQAHGIRNARDVLKELSQSTSRRMVVIDPRKTETAKLAHIHLQLRPGTDAFLLSAILAIWQRENLFNHDFIKTHTDGFLEIQDVLKNVPIADYVRYADVPLAKVEQVAREFASARSACVRVDLGLQQSLHSTLNSYLEKLLFLLSGHFAKAGGNNLHTFFVPLIGHSDDAPAKNWRTVASKIPGIGKLYPPNVLPEEIDNAGDERIRAVFVDSANPLLSGADTKAYQQAFAKLEFLVVVDVAMTETARFAHYVLPASSQYEKWEATFFNLDFPKNTFHLRQPVFEPVHDTLAEPEIYQRLLVAMRELPRHFPLLELIAKFDRKVPAMRLFPWLFGVTMKLRKRLRNYPQFVLAATLGKCLPHHATWVAPLWFAAHAYAQKHAQAVKRAGHQGDGLALGETLFNAILSERSGVTLSIHRYEDNWNMVRHADGKIHLSIPELLEQWRNLKTNPLSTEYPFTLIAGDRRSYNANTIFRDPSWRKTEQQGCLRMHPDDAAALRISTNEEVACCSAHGLIHVSVVTDDSLRRGTVVLPHGYGMRYGNKVHGPVLNLLTGASYRDTITATPFHKNVPVQILKLSSVV